MGILRRCFDNPDLYLEDPEWEPIDEQIARKAFTGFFVDVERALMDIAAGCVVSTDTAEYKRSPAGEQKEA